MVNVKTNLLQQKVHTSARKMIFESLPLTQL